ncbi:hypothetical protein IT407_02635 [Candidatus Uhrbacteria bacterium]|nr:hypothetical protein [Candidatus Uhrbacteria bacterium]
MAGGGQTFFYDTRGNVTEIRKFNTSGTEILAERRVNAYDIGNRMSTSTVGTVTSTGYLYDKAGMRLTQGDASSTMLYVSPAYNATLNSVGSVIDTEKHVGDGVRTYATIDGTGIPARVLFSHPDHLSGGSIITNSLNQVEQFLDYTPYGSVYLDQRVGAWSEQRQFTGHEYDSGTKYNYMKARYYEPGVKRFLSVDPAFLELSFKIEDPQSMNSYAYARNSPLTYVDPNGESVGAVVPLLILAASTFAPMAGYFAENPVEAIQNVSRVAPFSGDAIDVSEAVTGRDQYTGESLSHMQRAITAGAAVSPVVPGKLARGVSDIAAKMEVVRNLGKAGEDFVSRATGLVKNTKAIEVNGRTRYPDFSGVVDGVDKLIESKNVANLSATRQIRDFADAAENKGQVFEIWVKQNTNISGPLLQMQQDGRVDIIRQFK